MNPVSKLPTHRKWLKLNFDIVLSFLVEYIDIWSSAMFQQTMDPLILCTLTTWSINGMHISVVPSLSSACIYISGTSLSSI